MNQGGSTNLTRTQYAYSYLTYGRQLERTEQAYDSGWVNDYKVDYRWDAMERQEYEYRYWRMAGRLPAPQEDRSVQG